MKELSESILQEIEDINQSWTLRPNGNYYNPKISATIHKKDGEWKFVHDGQHKKGATTGEDTIPLCLADYLISGADYANNILKNLSTTNLSVDSIKGVTGLSEAHIESLIRQPQNENNAAHRAGARPKQTTQKLPALEKDLIDWDEVLKNDLKQKPSFRKDKAIENKPSDILNSWITTEVLSPNAYKKPADICSDPKKIASLTGTRLPWEKTRKIPEGMTLYYQVYLGSIDVKNAGTKLLELYKDDTQERISNSGYAPTAVVTVDEQGIPVDDKNDLVLSSFPWAYGRSLNNKLEHLRCWGSAETLLKVNLRDILFEINDDGKALPLNWEKIYYAYNFLIQNCNVPEEDCLEPTFSIKQHKNKPKKDKKPKTPNPPLLNSFYLSDLQRVQTALEDKNAGKALRQYIGDIPSPKLQDLLQDNDLPESILNPDNTPAGRWPGAGRHPLVLMQQTAVNIATTTLKDGGLFSVNGPPGTGKTTLLRDIVASVIIDRAKALSTFKYPEEAFTRVGDFYELDEKLKGHEILVASSNNNAVENISKELPQLSQIAEGLTDELNYFRTISDTIAEDKYKTWGLSAIALGKGENRRTFANSFWWNNDTSLRTYLKKVRGEEVPLATIKDKETGDEFQRVPLIIQQEDIPENPRDIRENWEKAQAEFNDKLDKAYKISVQTEELKEKIYWHKETKEYLKTISTEKSHIEEQVFKLDSELSHIKKNLQHTEALLESLNEQKKEYKDLKPSLFERGTYSLKKIFQDQNQNPWIDEYNALTLTIKKTKRENIEYAQKSYKKSLEVEEKRPSLREYIELIQTVTNSLEKSTNEIAAQSEKYDHHLITEAFWERPFKEQQLFSPNFTNKEQRLRDDVFVAAIKLHKAFIDGTAKPLGKNLGTMMNVLGGEPLSPDQDRMLTDLWASLFLVVPVISTTFASVTGMLRGVDRESFGWLLIDEAGQGTPQAAVGTIYRSKRVVSVGDPLQIPPVTSLPKPLLDSLATHHGVDPQDFTAPQASIQTLSDKANPYGTLLKRDFEDVRIGAPLLVHRRCENPMFRISNALAYNNLMVYATAEKNSPIKDSLGDSHWIHVTGTAENKWCPEEGVEVLNRLKKLSIELREMPDLYIISPFKIVAQKMRRLLTSNTTFFESYNISIDGWAKTHVGTVHTFQGKEAEAVFFLLGAPDISQGAARSWATGQVNILNVAVSRAKRAFYIIGNRDLWGKSGHMNLFSRSIPLP